MKQTFFCFGLLMIFYVSSSQDVLQKPDILPHSPEGAAFAKNINIPVSYSSGTPQISIPFYTVSSGGMSVPVSISYNASGIRVDETATWVGLGWSLSAGGQITRSVRGGNDERSTWGYMNVNSNRKVKYVDSAHCRCPNPDSETQSIESDINSYQLDLEPDQFSFSVLGYSGDFYYNQDSGKYILIPYQNIKVEGSPGEFTLTLPNGVKAFFGGGTNYEETLISGSNASYVDGSAQSPTSLDNTPQGNSWMLKLLRDPIGHEIEFTYTTETITTFGRGGERFGPSLSDGAEQLRRQSFYTQEIRKPVIQKISGDNVDVYFKRSSANRLDMPTYPQGSRSLDTIMITTRNNKELRSFVLNYGYFTSPVYSTSGLLLIDIYDDEARNRLYLKSITEKRGSDSLPPYEFTYSDIELPSRFSTAQDYWGYYNGKTNGTKLMPKIPSMSFYPWSPNYNEINQVLPQYASFFNSDGSDRRIDTNYTQARILNKIKYPTGGTTEYYYEQNSASATQLNIYGGMVPPDMVDMSFSFSLLSNPLPMDPPYPLYYSGMFSIVEPATQVKIIPQLPTCTTYTTSACKLEVKIKSLPDSSLIHTINTTNTVHLQLDKGQYLVEVFVDGSPNDYPPMFNVQFQWGERKDSVNFPVGGVRVKKIVSRDGTGGTISRSFSYHYDSTSESSGLIEGCATFYVHDINSEGQAIRRYYVSNSVLPLVTDGKTVRYEFVTEYFDSTQSSFKNSYTFSSGLFTPKKFSQAHTGAPDVAWNWQNNLLEKKQVYEKTSSGSYRLLVEENNFFKAYEPVYELYGLYGPQIIAYSMATEWYLPDSSITYAYSYEGGSQKVMTTSSRTLYNKRYFSSINKTTNSKGEKIHSKTWYPSDYNNVTGFNIAGLNSDHIWEVPIKQETSVNGKIVSGSIIKYNAFGLPVEGYAYEKTSLTDTAAHNPNTILTSDYKLRTTLSYDDQFNIKQINNYKSGPGTYIWDYQINGTTGGRMNEMPMAMVQNADSNHAAFTSFENASKGNWTYSGTTTLTGAVTGTNAYTLSSGNISKTGLSSTGKYLVSYWSSAQKTVSGSTVVKTGDSYNGLTYYEHKVENPSGGTVTISGSGTLDELRLYPALAQMTSYAYDSLWMVSSICDVNNRISYYHYDGLGRLYLVKDQGGNILKKICYNYSGQPENCGLGTDAQWQVDSVYCEKSSGVNTGNLIKRERDSNPNSSTYNQTRNVTINNAAECPVCNTSNCVGDDKKCINGICETGTKIYTGSVRISGNTYKCYYHYEWSDNSTSSTYEEFHEGPCVLN